MGKFYLVSYGLGGGFGGASDFYIAPFGSEEDASDEAREHAIETYESYGGMHGLWDRESLAEENGVDPDSDEAEEDYNDQLDSWLDYTADEVYRDNGVWFYAEDCTEVDMTMGFGVEVR